jgi:PAS domain S-box-containing protein
MFPDTAEAEAVLLDLAKVFSDPTTGRACVSDEPSESGNGRAADGSPPNLEAKYRALLEQIPAVVFMACLDRGISEAYVSPQIEAALGYSREEWLEDPIRWYRHIHPDDKQRWSVEAAEMFLSGKSLRSAYRVIARDGRVIWFHCDAKMMRREDGRPWFIHGVAIDISDLKRGALQLLRRRVRTFSTTSVGRLFDAAAALLGFVRETTFEGQAAIWLEQLAKRASNLDAYPFACARHELDFRPLLKAVIDDRTRGRSTCEIARAFQRAIAQGLNSCISTLVDERDFRSVVLSGGVFQNELLLEDLKPLLEKEHLRIWTNHLVPPNDGGISLGQAAFAAFEQSDATHGVAYA